MITLSNSKRRSLWRALLALPILGLVGWIRWPIIQTASAELGVETAAGVTTSGERTATEALGQTPAAVDAVSVVRATLPLVAEATGHLQPWRLVTLSPEIAGRVAWRGVVEGDRVEAGDVLVRLDTHDLSLKKSEAEANLLKARAHFAISFINAEQRDPPKDTEASGGSRQAPERQEELPHERARGLFEEGVISRKELERSKRRHEAAQMLSGDHREEVQAANSGLTQAEHQFEWAELKLARASLAAPFAGRVADVAIEVGQQLGAGESCLVLMDDSRIKVDVDVLESDMVYLRRGIPASVRVPALEDKVFLGEIHTINPRVDPETGTGRVTVVITNQGRALLPGLYAVVELETRRLENRVVVPSEALLERQDRSLVFRLENARAVWTYVETGVVSGGLTEIVGGLAEGHHVAVDGHFALAHEAQVEPTVLGDSDRPLIVLRGGR